MSGDEAVLDASAILAWLREEPGGEAVDDHLNGGYLSAVNAAEVAQKLVQHSADGAWAVAMLTDLGVVIMPFTSEDAVNSAQLWQRTRAQGLSLGDRACLALAHRAGRPAVTADAAWAEVTDLDVEVRLIR